MRCASSVEINIMGYLVLVKDKWIIYLMTGQRVMILDDVPIAMLLLRKMMAVIT
jgi:hypothetical protein